MRSARRPRSNPRFRRATSADLPFVDQLRRRDSRALGFLSRSALAEKIRLGLVRVATVGGRPAGFLLHGSMRRPEVRVFQLAVDPAYRGRGVARRLVGELVARSASAGARGLSLRCREELAANTFWHAAGFELHDLEPARRGALFVWVRRLQLGGLLAGDGEAPARNEANAGVRNDANAPARNEPIATAREKTNVTERSEANSPLRNKTSVTERSEASTSPQDETNGPARDALIAPARNEPTAHGGAAGSAEPFRFHSRWHPCPRCGRTTCDTWSAGGVRRRVCAGCAGDRPTGAGRS